MVRRVLYLRPPPMAGNGVFAYSERVLEAFRRYGDGRYELVDCAEGIAVRPEAVKGFARQLGERLAAELQREPAALVFGEMGVGEYQVFHALRGLKKLRSKLPMLVTVHDPPRTVVNLNPIFYRHQALTVVRGVRWLYNRTLGQGTEREFLAQGHHWLVLSEQGKRLWLERLEQATGSAAHQVSVLPHLNYVDLPLHSEKGRDQDLPLPPGDGRGEGAHGREDGKATPPHPQHVPPPLAGGGQGEGEAANEVVHGASPPTAALPREGGGGKTGEGQGEDGVPTPLRLGVLGSITRNKGIDLLLDALAALNGKGRLPAQLVLEIAGKPLFRQDERYLVELKRQVERLGIGERVVFSGYLAEDEVPGFFSRIDVLVLPYRDSGSGSASGPLMWARSLGIPVVASATRNLPEMIRDKEDGILCIPGDAGSLASALNEAMQEPQLARLRQGAALRREECSWRATVATLTALFDSIIEAQGNP